MKSGEFTIVNETGLHSRPANAFVKLAKEFSSTIRVTNNGTTVEAKSLLKVLKAGIKKGDTITITCEGDDEDTALEELGKYIKELDE